jgi:hypothetical protein
MKKLEVYYNNKILINNEFLKPSKTQTKPIVKIPNSNKYLTLIMYDPDALGGTHIHWLVVNIKNSNIENGLTLLDYKGPAPPPNTGKHRYIFKVYEQMDVLNLSPLEDRSISINYLQDLLKIDNCVYKIKFISKNETGGRSKKTKTKKTKTKKTKTKKTKTKKRM